MDANTYQQLYQQSIDQPEQFWAEQAKSLVWQKPWQTVMSGSLTDGNVRWFEGGELNVSVNCIDRHLPAHADKVALIWEGDDPSRSQKITYRQLHAEVCRFANVLKRQGVKKGDRVCIYLPMIPHAAYAMLACARIGAIHNVVFGGFSPESIKNRIIDAGCNTVITTDVGFRGGVALPYKPNIDQALTACPSVKTVIVVPQQAPEQSTWQAGRDVNYHTVSASVATECPPERMAAEDPLFILYTSGSTGKPKGVLHTTAGYLLYAALTHRTIFDLRPDDVYWCTADIGWITGHSYLVYGPLANAATALMFEGVPNYPSSSRLWEIIDKHRVSIFYTAPTAIRHLMAQGDGPLQSTTRNSLRILGSVGEPINPEAWEWYFHAVGKGRCPIMDTWWQTETGGILIAPPLEIKSQKPGAAMRPFFGIVPAIKDPQGHNVAGVAEGPLVITQPWPGMMRTLYGDHARFREAYLSQYPGNYCTGDGARRDEDGDYWITGRIDDVLNVAGHRIGTAEVESALVLHPDVAEAAVVGTPHAIKGEAIYAYVTLMQGKQPSDALRLQLIALVRKEIGPIAVIDTIRWTQSLPKTRSGKIMRRILRKIAQGETQIANLGDISTLANPECVEQLLISRTGG